MTLPVPPSVALDRSGTDWLGTFPGLGTVVVSPDGHVEVHPVDDGPTGEKAAALRHGWGELLASTRRGHSLALGAALVSADASAGALLVCGTAHEVAPVVLALTGVDWTLLSDRPTPTSWEDGRLIAHPRPAPFVMAFERAADSGRSFGTVRTPSNAVALDVPRAEDPAPIRALLLVQRRRPDEEPFTELSGHRKFERAASVMVGGVLASEHASDETAVSEHLRIAELPSAVLRIDGPDAGLLETVRAWWSR